MSVFRDYAPYYDLIYADKSYAAECEYVEVLLRRHDGHIHSILDLGCGTGRHADLFVRHGYKVVGVDRSPDMLRRAERRRDVLPPSIRGSLRFAEGDAREFDLGETFDAVVALFHSMGYLVETSDLVSAIRSVRRHLRAGGLFLFDFWYGPAVLNSPPTVRVKRLRDEHTEIVRIAQPALYVDENRVDVSYEIRILDLRTSQSSAIEERHRMRYLFVPELRELLMANGFQPISAHEWLTDDLPRIESWNACMLARATE